MSLIEPMGLDLDLFSMFVFKCSQCATAPQFTSCSRPGQMGALWTEVATTDAGSYAKTTW